MEEDCREIQAGEEVSIPVIQTGKNLEENAKRGSKSSHQMATVSSVLKKRSRVNQEIDRDFYKQGKVLSKRRRAGTYPTGSFNSAYDHISYLAAAWKMLS